MLHFPMQTQIMIQLEEDQIHRKSLRIRVSFTYGQVVE